MKGLRGHQKFRRLHECSAESLGLVELSFRILDETRNQCGRTQIRNQVHCRRKSQKLAGLLVQHGGEPLRSDSLLHDAKVAAIS